MVIAALNTDDPHHDEARGLLATARRGSLGRLLTSDYVYDEAVTLALKRFGAKRAREVDGVIGDPRVVLMIRLAHDEFDEARRMFLARMDSGLSLTDWSIVVQCERRRVGTILSFDQGFDGVYPRNAVPTS